ncbi:MAG TPA: glycoside hydrolase domain-containing protein [Planctomycetota bacterium]|nr:glycoside hydrolase domain-containing protein [Planctomycetota bacterium]
MIARSGLALLAALLVPAAAPLSVYVVGPLARVHAADAPGTVTEARLKASRNEVEAFQLVVRAGEGGLKGVKVEISDLKGETRSIERANIALYREQFIALKTPSPKSKEGPGVYPDALIPEIIPPPTGETPAAPAAPPRVRAMPFAVPAGLSQPLWIEVRVPKDAAPGDYMGTVKVSADGEKPVEVPVTLTVWDFVLPDTPSLRTNFGGLGRRLLTGHPGLKPDTPGYRKLERNYAASMAAHRICPPIPPYLRPKMAADGGIDPKETHAALKEWIETFHVTSIPITLIGNDPAGKDREVNVKFLKSTWAYLQENGWEKLAYVWVLDEPNVQAQYDEVRRRAKMVHETQPGLKVMCTEQPTPQDPAWGSLVGSVDLWVPLWSLYDEESVAERQKAGEEAWSYTALCEGGKGKDTPFWQLDFPLLNYRIPGWMSRRYGLRGLLYWTVVFWPESDPWINPLTYKQAYNDEGVLFYPGTPAGVDGPVESLRLKALRDGLEDYEYLVLAGDAGAVKATELAKSWTSWETDPAKLAAAREELAAIIVAKKK